MTQATESSDRTSKRIERAAIVSRLSSCALLLGIFALSAYAAEEPSYTPLPFACELRFNFREHGEKSSSAPSFEREALPLSRLVISDSSVARIVEGHVPHLPYRFLIKITRNSDADQGTLEVNVLDDLGQPLRGFPQLIANPLTRTGDSSRKDFDIPISEPLTKKIEETLLAKDQLLTHIDLIVGMDDDFLSADFPK